MTYPTTSAEAARLITDARSKISVNLPTYIGGEVHHVVPVSLVATGSGAGSGLVNDNVARLIEFSAIRGTFNINDPMANGLVLPGSTSVMSGQDNVALHLGNHTADGDVAYVGALKTRIQSGLNIDEDLREFLTVERMNELRSTGHIVGYTDEELNRLAAHADQILSETVSQFRYGLTAEKISSADAPSRAA